jgi:hypothetical protein
VGAPFYLAPFVGGMIYVYMNGPAVSCSLCHYICMTYIDLTSLIMCLLLYCTRLCAVQGITSATVPIKITSRSMKPEECRKLDCQNARFGFSLASAGDIDNDGYAGRCHAFS